MNIPEVLGIKTLHTPSPTCHEDGTEPCTQTRTLRSQSLQPQASPVIFAKSRRESASSWGMPWNSLLPAGAWPLRLTSTNVPLVRRLSGLRCLPVTTTVEDIYHQQQHSPTQAAAQQRQQHQDDLHRHLHNCQHEQQRKQSDQQQQENQTREQLPPRSRELLSCAMTVQVFWVRQPANQSQEAGGNVGANLRITRRET